MKIKDLRLERGLTKVQLAKELGVNSSMGERYDEYVFEKCCKGSRIFWD